MYWNLSIERQKELWDKGVAKCYARGNKAFMAITLAGLMRNFEGADLVDIIKSYHWVWKRGGGWDAANKWMDMAHRWGQLSEYDMHVWYGTL